MTHPSTTADTTARNDLAADLIAVAGLLNAHPELHTGQCTASVIHYVIADDDTTGVAALTAIGDILGVPVNGGLPITADTRHFDVVRQVGAVTYRAYYFAQRAAGTHLTALFRTGGTDTTAASAPTGRR